MSHKDSLGQPLAEGDILAYVEPYGSDLAYGTVVSFTPQQIRVIPNKPRGWMDEDKKGLLRYPSTTVKVTEQYKAFATEHPEMLV